MKVVKYEGDRVLVEFSLIDWRGLCELIFFGDRDPMEDEDVLPEGDLVQRLKDDSCEWSFYDA